MARSTVGVGTLLFGALCLCLCTPVSASVFNIDGFEWQPLPDYDPTTSMYFHGSFWNVRDPNAGNLPDGVVVWGERGATIDDIDANAHDVNPSLSQRAFNLPTDVDAFPDWTPDVPDADPGFSQLMYGNSRYGIQVSLFIDWSDPFNPVIDPNRSLAGGPDLPSGMQWQMGKWDGSGHDSTPEITLEGTIVDVVDYAYSGDGVGGIPDYTMVEIILAETDGKWDDPHDLVQVDLNQSLYRLILYGYESGHQIELADGVWLNEWVSMGVMTPVPEPATMCLLAIGGLLAVRRRT